MFPFVAFCILAVTSAAPQFGYPQYGRFDSSSLYDPFSDDVFDTSRFWSEFASEMDKLHQELDQFYKRFPSDVTAEGVQGNEYKIKIVLTGYEEKDINVKAREGVLMIQAVRGTNTFLAIRTLPDNVDVKGTWSYDNGVLEITFPLKNTVGSTSETSVTYSPVTDEPKSREEMEKTATNDNKDADVGLENATNDNRDSDFDEQENELNTNQISRNSPVEATTYAVDLKNEVEFVPVRFN